MTKSIYRALVVDDEPAVRMVTLRELTRRGFSCDVAANGWQAKQLTETQNYDVVVTDLRMPEMNGHAFAVDLLSHANRPVVIVLTGVTEPKIAKDLISRGVDDVMFKPVDQGIVAAKVWALVEQRAARLAPRLGAASAAAKSSAVKGPVALGSANGPTTTGKPVAEGEGGGTNKSPAVEMIAARAAEPVKSAEPHPAAAPPEPEDDFWEDTPQPAAVDMLVSSMREGRECAEVRSEPMEPRRAPEATGIGRLPAAAAPEPTAPRPKAVQPTVVEPSNRETGGRDGGGSLWQSLARAGKRARNRWSSR